MSNSEIKMLVLNALQVFDQQTALFNEVSFKVLAGEILIVMGPSGCGKSSLLSAIAGTLDDNLTLKGQVVLNNKTLNSVATEHRGIGIQFQDDLLFPHLNVAGNLLFALPKGDKAQRHFKVKETLTSAGLAGFEQRDIATLSGGQRARISLLRTLLAEPKLMLLDEPFSSLDEQLRGEFRIFVYSQIKRLNIPAILVTHDKQDCLDTEFFALEKGCYASV